MFAKRRRNEQESGEISCALSANGCDVVVGDYHAKQRHAQHRHLHLSMDKRESDVNASALITVPVVFDTAATMPVVGADLSKAVGSFKKTKVSVSLDTANGLRHIIEAVDVPNAKG